MTSPKQRWRLVVLVLGATLCCLVAIPAVAYGLRAAQRVLALSPGDTIQIRCATRLSGTSKGQEAEVRCAPRDEAAPTAAGSTSAVPTAAAPTPAPAVAIISGDGIAGWANWSWGGSYNTDASAQAHSGSTSIEVTYQDAWVGLYLHSDQPIRTQGFSAIRFFVNGGAHGGQRLRLCASNTCTTSSTEVTAQANIWTQIDVPLSQLGNPAKISDLVWQNTSGGAQPAFYIDDVALVAP